MGTRGRRRWVHQGTDYPAATFLLRLTPSTTSSRMLLRRQMALALLTGVLLRRLSTRPAAQLVCIIQPHLPMVTKEVCCHLVHSHTSALDTARVFIPKYLKQKSLEMQQVTKKCLKCVRVKAAPRLQLPLRRQC